MWDQGIAQLRWELYFLQWFIVYEGVIFFISKHLWKFLLTPELVLNRLLVALWLKICQGSDLMDLIHFIWNEWNKWISFYLTATAVFIDQFIVKWNVLWKALKSFCASVKFEELLFKFAWQPSFIALLDVVWTDHLSAKNEISQVVKTVTLEAYMRFTEMTLVEQGERATTI